jgi:hypothetical protein
MSDKPASNSMSTLIEQLESAARFRDAELQQLRTEPNMALVMTQLADEFENSLAILFNYSHATWSNGEGQDDIQDVYEKICDHFEASFKKMLGVAYIPNIARQYRFAQREKQRNAEKFLDAVMRPVTDDDEVKND